MNYRIRVPAGRNRVFSWPVLFGLTLLSFSVVAAPPNAPVLTGLDDQVLEPPNPGGRYSLDDATRDLPFTVNTPIPPQVVAEQVVTPSTLGNYINTPGMRLILEPGNYGNRMFNSQDQEIILRGEVYFGYLSIGGAARRIVIRTEVPRSGNMIGLSMPEGGAFPEDILVDGINSNDGGNRNFIHGQRVAIINSFIRTVDFPLAAFNAEYNDIIIANCDLQAYGSMQAGVRLQGTNRLVFVDNRVRKTGSGHNVYRVHLHGAQIEHSYTARNQFEGPRMIVNAAGGGDAASNGFTNVWMEDNTLYMLPGGSTAVNIAADYGQERGLDHFVLTNNAAFGVTSYWLNPVANSYPGWTISGNSISGYAPPPEWGFR